MTHQLNDRSLVLLPLLASLVGSKIRHMVAKYTRTPMKTCEGEKVTKKMTMYAQRHALSEAEREDDLLFPNNLHGEHRSQSISS